MICYSDKVNKISELMGRLQIFMEKNGCYVEDIYFAPTSNTVFVDFEDPRNQFPINDVNDIFDVVFRFTFTKVECNYK